jgi:hypothetical protein
LCDLHERILQKLIFSHISVCPRHPQADADAQEAHKNSATFGAVCPDRGVGAGFALPRANAHAMNQHL